MNSRAIDRRLHIQGFKSPCDITMEQVPLRVVFGPDAAGTSKLLEAVVQEALGEPVPVVAPLL
jgi:predicted ATP-dependent endonuclease of OLD family